MPSLFRQTITRHILDGRRVPAGTPGAVKTTTRSKKWYGEIPDPNGGRPLRVPLSTNRAASIQMLGQLIRDQGDPTAAYRRTPLTQHITDHLAEISSAAKGKRGRPPSPRQVATAGSRLRRVLLTECRYTHAHQITLDGVRQALARLAEPPPRPTVDREEYTRAEALWILGIADNTLWRMCRRWNLEIRGKKRSQTVPRATVEELLARGKREQPWGAMTTHFASQALRRFTAWLVRRKRLPADSLLELRAGSAAGDHRHDRRPLTDPQMRRLLVATRASTTTLRGLTGEDRYQLYLTAAATGFRAAELASLTPELFALNATPPVVHLPDRVDKAGRKTVQPIPRAVADELRAYLAAKQAGEPVWPGRWHLEAAEVLRVDLTAAGIPYAIQGPDGPLYADFHALRHTFIASLDRAGVTLKQAMHLARHSTPVLTARVYGRADLAELAAAADRIGGLVTGMVAGTNASECHNLTQSDTPEGNGGAGKASPQPPTGQANATD